MVDDFEPSVPDGFEDIEAAADEAIEADTLDMPEDGAASVKQAGSVITGGEGFGAVRRRHLLVLMPLPSYPKDAAHPERGIDLLLQGQMLESDIREAMAKSARKLHDTAMKYSVTGYEWDLDDIEYDMPVARTLSATLVIERA